MKLFQRYPKDLTGVRFGHLTVIGLDHSDGRKTYWKCRCDCGNMRVVIRSLLTRGTVTYCRGHYENMVGRKFNHLTVIRDMYVPGQMDGRQRWECICDCGNITYANANQLIKGTKKTCGCLYKTEADKIKRTTRKRLGLIYHGIVQRCYNPKSDAYHNYGGRGITICKEWYDPKWKSIRGVSSPGCKKFIEWALKSGYNPMLTLDRVNTNKPYSPDNCRWADNKMQSNNRRNTRVIITPTGERIPLAYFAEQYSVDIEALAIRIRCGWSIDALVYYLEHPELGIHMDLHHIYKDKDSFYVLIPKRGYSYGHGVTV